MITPLVKPQEIEPVYNPIIITATSSRQNLDNYLMIGDIYVDGVNVQTLKVAQSPSGIFLFDLHKHIEREISYDFQPDALGWQIATQSAASYSVIFSEEWRPQWAFFDNFFLPGSKLGFIGTQSSFPDGFATGSQISVAQTEPFTFSQYNGLATIVAIIATSSPSPGFTGNHWIIETNKTFLGNTPVNGGTISLASFDKATATGLTAVGENESLWAFNGVNDFLSELSWTSSAYRAGLTTSTGTASFLTRVPDNWRLSLDGRMFLLTFNPTANSSNSLEVETNKGVFRLTNTHTSPSLTNKENFLHVGCGPWHLGQTSSFTVVSGSFPIIDSDTKEYKVWVRNPSGTTIIAEKTFKLDRRCASYETTQLIFLDSLGSFIPYTFKLKRREYIDMTRTFWGQHYGRYDSQTTFSRGKTTLDTQVRVRWDLTTDWLQNDIISRYMSDLLKSPEVYYIDEAGVAVAVNILNVETEIKKVINDQIINYDFSIEFSQKNSSQRG